MLAAKIVQFSEEREGKTGGMLVVIALVSLRTIACMTTSMVHSLQQHAQEKRRPT